ncbi:MAG: hypothetical protein DLM57_06305 [Pseudonocardiales bacterium]|nr:MAG: hypothetical protein DLM57_06305 [Pseudonocardiales bacterium]
MSASDQPALRIVRGAPTPEELAAVTALVTAVSSGAGAAASDARPGPREGRWNDPGASHRRPWRPGPGAWRASLR